MKRTTTREIRSLIQQHIECKTGGSLYAKWLDGENYSDRYYVVYSYGPHFPIYLWSTYEQRWYGNKDKYSLTTTMHQTAAQPTYVYSAITWLDTDQLREKIRTRPAQRVRLVRNRIA